MVSNDRRTHGNQHAHNQHAHTVRKVSRATSSYTSARAAETRRPIRARLLGGASSVALSAASVIAASGVCVPGDAQAQTITQLSPLSLSNNPIVLGPATNIDTTATVAAHAIFGAAGTAWDVTT